MEQQYTYEKIELPTVGDVVVIEDAVLMELPEYSTGVFVNKMWRRLDRTGNWIVCEYVPHSTDPSKCRVVRRRAMSPETIALVAERIFWWLSIH